ncbi:MAG: IS110 family transposase [Chitinophagaceae bacterium]
MEKEKKQISLEVVHPNAAGIDIGSRSHWVAVGQHAEDVKEFGVYSEDQMTMSHWLHQKGVTHIAMESTGTYWQNLFATLVGQGFEVILVNGKQTKNIKGKKTDIKDCQWIQKLHSLGLLSASFLPDSDTDIIRTYSRHRLNLINQSASCVKRMQKFLRLMNMRLEVVVKDIVGLTGTQIIKAFIGGETDGKKLAAHRHYNCKKSEEEIAKALQYNGRKDYLFALTQEWNTYMHLQKQIAETDTRINELIKNIIAKDDNKKQHIASEKRHKRKNKNSISGTDMNQLSYQYFEGIDLMAIEGFNDGIMMNLMSEVGLEGIKKFETAKQFTSWLRLAPNNKISGGKVLSHHLPKGSSRLKIAFRNAANAIGLLKEGHLVDFFRRINYKKGRITAVSALARKLAVIVWNMIVKRMPYKPPTPYLFLDEKRKLGLVNRIKKQITKFEITNAELGIVTT